MKICNRCNITKELKDFYRSKGVCKQCIKERQAKNYNSEKAKAYNKLWKTRNKELITEEAREKNNVRLVQEEIKQFKKRQHSPNLNPVTGAAKLNQLRNKIRKSAVRCIREQKLVGITGNYLGCSPKQYKDYIESLFQSEMNWYNWSFLGWHLDHIVPLWKFDLTKEEDLKKACHYTNTQPLWHKDHRIKCGEESKEFFAKK